MSHCALVPLPVCVTGVILDIDLPFTGTGTPLDPLTLDVSSITQTEACQVFERALCRPSCVATICAAVSTCPSLFCELTQPLADFGALQCV